MDNELSIENLHVSVQGQPILNGINLNLKQGTVHAIMGPNGSGKSTLAYAIMGHPGYEVTQGKVWMDGTDLLELEPHERSRAGLFLAFQYPTAIPGVTLANFLPHSVSNIRNPVRKEGEELISMREFRKELREEMKALDMDPGFARRYLNDGFSGGEKKRAEILQLSMLRPRFAVLDETDSGLDIDALRIVSDGVNRLMGPEMGVLVITHYQRLLDHIKPDFVHIMFEGRIVESGNSELALKLEEKGYDWNREKYPEFEKTDSQKPVDQSSPVTG